MQKAVGVILAAGEGTRMENSRPKVLHEVSGEPMIYYPIESLIGSGIEDIYVVVGHQKEKVKSACSDKNISFVTQERLLGTADALKSVIKKVHIDEGTTIVLLYGDFPLIRAEYLRDQLRVHNESKADCTIATSTVGKKEKWFRDYGKVIRGSNGEILEVKERDELDSPESYGEINLGIYCFKYSKKFNKAINSIEPSEKGEFYLTAAVKYLQKKGLKILSYKLKDPCNFVGVNTQKDVAKANKVMNKRRIEEIMQQGVTIIAPENTFIQERTEIGRDSIIYPNAIIENGVKIGKGCKIGPNCRLRNGTILEDKVEIGNFVEIVRSRVKENVNIKHFSYIGDAVIGNNVNIGAGTVTANYDGKNKNTTKIKKNAFIGSGTILVAPVTVGEGATTGAGSVIPKGKDVGPGETVVGVPARKLNR